MYKYPVNKGQDGSLPIKDNIQKNLTDLLEQACSKHHKVLPVRLDVRYPCGYQASGDNKDISRMMAKLVQKYERQGLNPQYAWAREQHGGDNPHYHCVLLLDGQKVRSFKHVFTNANKLWKSTIGVDDNCKGLIHHCTSSTPDGKFNNGILLVRTAEDFQEKFNVVHNQVSYLAKTRGKGELKDGVRDFGISRLH